MSRFNFKELGVNRSEYNALRQLSGIHNDLDGFMTAKYHHNLLWNLKIQSQVRDRAEERLATCNCQSRTHYMNTFWDNIVLLCFMNNWAMESNSEMHEYW